MIDENQQVMLKNYSDAVELLKYIKEHKDNLIGKNKPLETFFMNSFYQIIFRNKTLLFNQKYIDCFGIIIKALDEYQESSIFPELREFVDKRIDFLSLILLDSDCNFNLFFYSRYLIAYAYYHSMNIEDYQKILICFIEKFDEIIDWAKMNQLTNEWGMYTNIKSENYSYLTNYLLQRTKNKEIR